MTADVVWLRVADLDQLPSGRVTTVQAGHRSIALSHFDGRYGALENRCPHQGGPLGEGSIENGWLRCPWHGYDYDPLTGEPPSGFADRPERFDVDVRADGIYVALPPEPARARTVSDVMVETMTNWGVDHVFGMVGHSNLGFADALREAEVADRLRFVGVRHEGAAAFAASAYAKLTGRLAACFAIAGPGSTNLLTGLYDAKVDRAPVLALSGQVPSKVRGRGAFQDVDLSAAFADVAGYSQVVQAASDHSELMTLACKHALVARGVAHLVFPDEVQAQPAPEGAAAGDPAGRRAGHAGPPPDAELELAVALVEGARRPVVVVGHGAREAIDDVVAFAEFVGAPIITTFKGKGLIGDDHPLAGGVLGRSGTPVASWLMNESDLIVVFGASFSDHTGIASYKPIVQIDRDPMQLGRFHPVTVALLGDNALSARALRTKIQNPAAVDPRPDIAARWDLWREEKRRRADDDRHHGVASASLFASLSRAVDADAVVAVDVGNNTYSFGRYFECRRQSVLMSGYLGSIGFGLPAAMGAWAACTPPGSDPTRPSRQIVAVCGDGGLGQYLAELATLAKYRMNITIVVLNNGQLGKISKEQRAAQWDVWQTSLHNPSFAAVARECGLLATRVDRRDALDDALRNALDHTGPALVEVMTDADLI